MESPGHANYANTISYQASTQLGLLQQVGGGDVAKRDHVTFHLGKTTF